MPYDQLLALVQERFASLTQSEYDQGRRVALEIASMAGPERWRWHTTRHFLTETLPRHIETASAQCGQEYARGLAEEATALVALAFQES